MVAEQFHWARQAPQQMPQRDPHTTAIARHWEPTVTMAHFHGWQPGPT